MSIVLEPSELTFRRPFTREVVQTLHIKNPNFDPVVFKVKTTAPKQYCVRPNSGRIESGQQVEVQVLLQAMKSDPPADYKCRDKFLVQSISITADREATNVQQIWSHVERTEKLAICEHKIRVVYLQPGEEGGDADDAGNNPIGEFASPLPTYSSPPNSAPNDLPSSAPREGGSELSDASATIARLEAELQNMDARLRKTAGAASDVGGRISEGTAGMGMTTHPPEGIPVPICAALCLVSFIIAWFFF